MSEYQWLNRGHPQTLQTGTLLLYVEGVFAIIGWSAIPDARALLIGVAMICGAFGIANDKRWGYGLALAASVIYVVLMFVIWDLHVFSNFNLLFDFAFAAALVALLLHPMSRNYQRIWFR